MPQRLLLCAPAGTGKTRYCIDEFQKALQSSRDLFETSSFFILPNREHADRINDILLRRSIEESRVLFDSSILTINDFIRRFVGIFTDSTPGDLLKASILKKTLVRDEMVYFAGQDKNRGVVTLLSDFVSECKNAFLAAGDFKRLLQKIKKTSPDTLASGKLNELALLLGDYEKELEARKLRDPGDLIRLLIQSPRAKQGLGSIDTLVFDGFYHFTPAQMEFLKYVSGFAKRTVVTLTVDRDTARTGVFDYPEKTRRELLAAGFKEEGPGGENRRAAAAVLKHIERNLFFSDPPEFGRPQEDVTIFEATGLSGEIEMIAREILKLYRGAYQYSDFCVLLRSISPYERVIRAVFRKYGIPVEIQERRKLKDNPLIRAFVHWIHVLRNDWEREELFRFLKNGYFRFDTGAVQILETRAREAGITAGTAAWKQLAADCPPNVSSLIEKLLGFDEELRTAQNGARAASILRKFMQEQELPYRVVDLSLDSESVFEDNRAFQKLDKILEEVTEIADKNFSLPEWLDFLLEAVDITLFSLPMRGKNRVQVYNIAPALQKEYKVVFVAGLLEGNFPKRILEDPLLRDSERELLNSEGERFELRKSRHAGERYFFYMAVTRAREKVYLSYPRFDLEGKESLPSFYVEEVKNCLGEKGTRIIRRDAGQMALEPSEFIARRDLEAFVVKHLYEKTYPEERPAEKEKLLAQFWNEAVREDGFRRVMSLMSHAGRARLTDPEILAWHAERAGPFSATRLEVFATCPFKYFASQTLGLQDEDESLVEVTMHGRILHKVLEEFYAIDVPKNRKIFEKPEKVHAAVERRLEEVLSRDEFKLPGVKKYLKELQRRQLRTILKNFIDYELSDREERGLEARYFEQSFGRAGSGLPSLQLGGIQLQGQIDRIDADDRGAVIVDYKSSDAKALALKGDLELGISLQLPIYILAARELLSLKIIGAELYPIKKPQGRKGLYADSASHLYGKKRTLIFPEPELEKLLDSMKRVIEKSVEGIRAGDISIKSKRCDHCSFDSLCRFEKWKLIYSEKEKVWRSKK